MKKIDISEYTMMTNKISNPDSGFKFIFMSDLHSNQYGINLHEVNHIIKKAKPDAILIGGDMINRHMNDDPSGIANYLVALAKHYPVFYGLGNHEYFMKRYIDKYGEKFYQYRDYLEENGVVFLEDETVFLEKDDNKIALSAVEIDASFYSIHNPVMGGGLMDKHLGNANTSFFNLLLAHNPEFFNNYEKWGADLVLSGHVHGGTVRIGRIGGVMSTKGKLFPKYDGGMYADSQSTMIVSRGMGAHTIKVRINNRPEIVILKVLAKK